MLRVARRLLPMGVLYGGRIGVAGLGFVILPLLSSRMSAEQFGLVATVLSLQSLAIVLDLGLSIVLASELPAMDVAAERHALVRRSERRLIITYLIVAAVAAALSAGGVIPVALPTTLLICVALLAVVWQNIIAVAMISRQQFLASTISLFVSLLLRQGASLALVILYAGTLQAFVVGQVAGAAIVLAISRLAFLADGHRHDTATLARAAPAGISIAVMVYTIAGASALQLDKILLSALGSPLDTGPYFLASTLSLIPITFLAAPISQFVQPKLIASLSHGQFDEARRWIARLTAAIAILAVAPGIMLGLLSPHVVAIWLQGSANQAVVSHYVALLMPGASLGALGMVPAIVLIARRDYRALAAISAALTIAVLSTTALLAARDDITGICITYAIYHTLAAVCLWWRAWRIEPTFADAFAIRRYIANEVAKPVRRDLN